MSVVLEAPAYEYFGGYGKQVFIAGGISGCSDWQAGLLNSLEDVEAVFFNPRRSNFDINNPADSVVQIKWEHTYLKEADIISFWFAPETLCPITLYELGYWLGQDKQIVVGIHPDYQRKMDVEIQTSLIRPDVRIVYKLQDLAEVIREML